ncbi:MAG: restriction endonuclease subunit S, partial [Thermodesulfobacteriota bacterium]
MSRPGWEIVPLCDLLEGPPRNGYSPKEASDWTGTQMLGLGCLTVDGFWPLQLKNAPIGDQRLKSAILQEGDLLVSRSNTRELVGLAGIYADVGTPCTYPDLMMRLRPNERLTARYLERYLLSASGRRQIQAAASGTSGSMVKISGPTVMAMRVSLPSVQDQNRITEVLDTVDEAIRKTEQVIAKLQQMKQGLLHDLLTRGIDHNGELRPPPSEAPHLYKDSPSGKVPREWNL